MSPIAPAPSCRRAAVGAVAVLALLAPAAGAKAPAVVQATFSATLTGSQVTTWDLHRGQDDADPCDASATGHGDQTIRFGALQQRFRVTFARPPKGDPDLFSSAGRPAVLTSPVALTLAATAERHGEHAVDLTDLAGCDGQNGGGVDPAAEPPADCGTRQGAFKARLFFHDTSADAGIMLPLGRPTKEKDRLRLSGDSFDWETADGRDTAAELGDTFKNCPWDLAGAFVPKVGGIYTAAERIPEARLFDKRRKRLTVSGSTIQRHVDDDASGRTILAWNLRLTRVR